MRHPLHVIRIHIEARTHICCMCGAYEAALQGVKCLSDALIAGKRREAF